MSHRHQITEPAACLAFLAAGNATFTVENPETGGRRTFKVSAPRDEREAVANGTKKPAECRLFVKLLTGPSNTSDYTYLGMLTPERNGARTFKLTRKSPSKEHGGIKGFAWVFGRLAVGRDLGPVRFWHEGRCGRCNRKLTVPASIVSGLGPICAGMAA